MITDMQLIYADNAATTKLDPDAFEAMKPFLLHEYGNASQPYSFSRSSKTALKEARRIISACINAEPEEVYFTSGGTESDNWAIKGIAFASPLHMETITSTIEHHAVLNSCRAIERLGYPVLYLNVTPEGIVSPVELAKAISRNTRLVSVMLVNNEIGIIQPVKELCTVAHANGALFHTDAVQALGHIPLDVRDLGVDLLSASAHKFNGPKGVGFLYVKKGTTIIPYADGGAQEYQYRAGTENVASIVGMAVALKRNIDSMSSNASHVQHLDEILIRILDESSIDYLKNGKGSRIPGINNLSFYQANGETLLHRLDLMGICVSTGSACDSMNTQISHVLQAMNISDKYAQGTIRISLGKNNTEEEVESIAKGILRVLKNTDPQ